MLRWVTLIGTLSTFLCHVLLGCCWHHADCQPIGFCSKVEYATEVGELHRQDRGHHQCRHNHSHVGDSGSSAATDGCSKEDENQPHHRRCDDEVCKYVKPSLVDVPNVEHEVMWTFTLPSRSVGESTASRPSTWLCEAFPDGLPPDRTACAVTEVWLL